MLTKKKQITNNNLKNLNINIKPIKIKSITLSLIHIITNPKFHIFFTITYKY